MYYSGVLFPDVILDLNISDDDIPFTPARMARAGGAARVAAHADAREAGAAAVGARGAARGRRARARPARHRSSRCRRTGSAARGAARPRSACWARRPAHGALAIAGA